MADTPDNTRDADTRDAKGCDNKYSAGVDWITIIAPLADPEARALMRVAQSALPHTERVYQWKRYGYQMETCRTGLAVGQNHTNILLQLSGQSANTMFPEIGTIERYGWKATRLDLRLDINGDTARTSFSRWITQIQEHSRSMNYSIQEWRKGSSIETVYLHCPTYTLCCYDKGLQQGELQDWIRLELRFKRETASKMYQSIYRTCESGEPIEETILYALRETLPFITLPVRGSVDWRESQHKPASDGEYKWLRTVVKNYVQARGIQEDELIAMIYGRDEDYADSAARNAFNRVSKARDVL